MVGNEIGEEKGDIGGKMKDVGIDDNLMKDEERVIKKGREGMLMMIRKMKKEKVMEDIKGIGGKVVRKQMEEKDEKELRKEIEENVV